MLLGVVLVAGSSRSQGHSTGAPFPVRSSDRSPPRRPLVRWSDRARGTACTICRQRLQRRHHLRRELSQLRATLGEEAIVADRRQIGWGPGHWVDVVAFGAQIAAARAHAHPEGLCDACAGALAQAAQLAGADLLEGYHLADSPTFEDWLFFQREELRQQLAWALEARVEWHGRRGELQEALTLARRWLSLDPLHEPARRALMRLAALAGQQAAALRYYEEGARLLEAELGAAPEEAIVELYEAMSASPRARSSCPL